VGSHWNEEEGPVERIANKGKGRRQPDEPTPTTPTDSHEGKKSRGAGQRLEGIKKKIATKEPSDKTFGKGIKRK